MGPSLAGATNQRRPGRPAARNFSRLDQTPARSTPAGCRTDGATMPAGVLLLCGVLKARPTPPTGAVPSPSAWATPKYVCGVRTNGRVECWGWNEYGQASPPTGSFRLSAQVPAIPPAGYGPMGPSACWGANHAGQADFAANGTFTLDWTPMAGAPCGRAD